MRSHFILATAAILGLGLPAGTAAAQEPVPAHAAFQAGLFQFDLSGTGWAPMLAFRATRPVSSVLLLEAGMLASRPAQQFGGTTTFLSPEAQLQLVLPFEQFVPYMGLGVGAALDFRGAEFDGTSADLAITGALGMKAWLTGQMGGLAEFRVRGIGLDFVGSSAEYTVGLIWRI